MLLNNKYEYDPKTNLLGTGSFGSVYYARDIVLDRHVALKVSRQAEFNHARYSIISEVSRLIDLPRHPNLVCYYDGFVAPGMDDLGQQIERQVAVLELVEGENLQTELETTKLAYSEIKPIASGILNGLKHLHQHKILHRDIKPSNIIIKRSNDQIVPKITDFGVSKVIQEMSGVNPSAVIGTVAYMAPELFFGGTQEDSTHIETSRKIDFRADLWSFGVVLYQMISNELPYGSIHSHTTAEMIHNILETKISQLLNEIPEQYHTIISKCLQRNPNDRYFNADEILEDLNRIEEEDSTIPNITLKAPEETDSSTHKINIDYEEETILNDNILPVEGLSEKQRKKFASTSSNWEIKIIIFAFIVFVVIAILAWSNS